MSISIQAKIDQVLGVFLGDPLHNTLNNHALWWKLLWTRSINVTGDYRIHFVLVDNTTYEMVEIVNVWTHSQLYG